MTTRATGATILIRLAVGAVFLSEGIQKASTKHLEPAQAAILANAGIHLSANQVACILIFALAISPTVVSETSASSSIAGVVRYEGEVPLRKSADNEGKHRPVLTVDRTHRGLADTMVYLRPIGAVEKLPGAEVPDCVAVVIQQEDYEFVPRVVGVRAGQMVVVGNRDYANHNVRTTALNTKNTFNVITPAEGMHEHVIQAEPSDRPIRLSCDIHPWMSGWIYVFDHDRFAFTGEDGRFQIENVPAGAYLLLVTQPDGKLHAETEIDFADGASVTASVTFGSEHLGRGEPGTIHVKVEPSP
jgi:plastocyanin